MGERFQIGESTPTFFALGVQHPTFPAGKDKPDDTVISDVGLLLLLNGRDVAGTEQFPTLVAAGDGLTAA